MQLPPVIIKLSGFRDTLQDEPLIDLYLGESRFVADKIKTAFATLDQPAFYVEEQSPSFDLAVDALQKYPRDSYFLMASVTQPDRNLEITQTPLGYYDLLLFRPDLFVTIRHPETFILSLHHAWDAMTRFMADGIVGSLGVENFYDNQYLALTQLVTRSGLPYPSVNALPDPDAQLVDLVTSLGTQIIAKLPIELSDITVLDSFIEMGVSSFLLDDFPTSGQAPLQEREDAFFDIFAQASYFQNETWDDSGEMDDFSSPEEEI